MVLLALVFGFTVFLLTTIGVGYSQQPAEIPYRIRTISNASDLPQNKLTYAPNFVHLEAGQILTGYFIVGNQGTTSEHFGIEMKSGGTFPDYPADGLKHISESPVPNIRRTIVAKLTALGAVGDSDTDGANASCFTFDLAPGFAAEIPFTSQAKDNVSFDTFTYFVQVKVGSPVSCSVIMDSAGNKYFTGLLESGKGEQYQTDWLPITVGSL
jgi:hypothetical protein